MARIHPRLPIFRLDRRDDAVLYSPGHVAVASLTTVDALQQLFTGGGGDDHHVRSLAGALERRAEQAVAAWERLGQAPFEPECLTVYLSNSCNLGCSYCFAAPEADHAATPSRTTALPFARLDPNLPVLEERVVSAAARTVAQHCVRKHRPFTLVVHGGGEPTLHWELLQRVTALTRQIADEHGIEWSSYIATHGVISEDKARWLARNVSHIGLSCDGPPDVQDRQRPTLAGTDTSAIVERTAAIFADTSARFDVRATITPRTVRHQVEIVAYLRNRLRATRLSFEPVYAARGRASGFRPEDAEEFVAHYLDAERAARQLGCELRLSGVRLDEIHGPYCNVLRDVLHLTPDGSATACFLCTDGREPDNASMVMGRLDPSTGAFVIDEARVAAMRHRALRIPARCHECVNVHHCVRECPEVCPVAGGEDDPQRAGGFRCRIQKLLAETWIRDAGGQLPSRVGADDER